MNLEIFMIFNDVFWRGQKTSLLETLKKKGRSNAPFFLSFL